MWYGVSLNPERWLQPNTSDMQHSAIFAEACGASLVFVAHNYCSE